MRSKNVTIAGKDLVLRELKIRDIKEKIIPKVGTAWEEVSKGDMTGLVDRLGVQIVEIFPELQGIDIEECYPSELETFVEAWIDVNFTGVKRLLKPLMSLAQLGQPKPE